MEGFSKRGILEFIEQNTQQDVREDYMRRAIDLAWKGAGRVNPNPMVGCVIVKGGRIIGEGYHEKYGEFHAERNALMHCTEDPEGADLYVTLEPCCHTGKTPPCTDIIIEKKIGRVIVGCKDPNPLVGGKGIEILRDAGIEVQTGMLEKECRKMNEVFFHFIETGTPFVVMKFAMSLDGKIACATGDYKWVTGEQARHKVQLMRKRYAGIMVGMGTVENDDPMLTCRIEEGVNPVRIVCDSRLRIGLDTNIMKTAGDVRTIIACSEGTLETEEGKKRESEIIAAGAEVIPTEGAHGVNLGELMKKLGEMGIDSVLLEGGGTLNSSAIDAGIVNKVYAFIAPKIIGGEAAPSPVRGLGAMKMDEALVLDRKELFKIGEDVMIVGYPR